MEFDNSKLMFLIESLRRNDMSATKIHDIVSTAWPDDAPKLRRIQQIVKELNDGTRESFDRAQGSGRRVSDTRKDSIGRIEEAVTDDPNVTVAELSSMHDLSESMVYRILSEDLEKIWMHTRWVPHVLTQQNKDRRVECCENILTSVNSRIARANLITIDEKWFYCRKMLPRNVVGSWMGPYDDRRQTAVRCTMEKKFLAIIAVSSRGNHFFKVLDRGATIDSEVYIEFLQEMRQFLSNLPEPILFENVRLIHDNARPHVSQATRQFLEGTAIRLLPQPAYSPDCNLCDRYIFPRLEAIRGRDNFTTKDELSEFLTEQLPMFTRHRMGRALSKMEVDLRAIINKRGEYL